MREKIFAILYYSSTLNAIKFIGTGFLISKQGDFITAGHTFGNLGQLIFDNKNFRALFIDNSNNNQCVAFSKICYKHLKMDNQSPPILYDIAYGSLEKGEYKYFEIANELPSMHTKLHAHHYKSNDRSKTFGKSFSELSNINLLGYFSAPMSIFLNKEAFISEKNYQNCMELRQNSRIEKGASGCPLINVDGNVSGLFIAASEINDKRYALSPLSISELRK